MTNTFPIHDLASAPAASRPYLEQARKDFGQIPNLIGEMAESPAVIRGYLGLAAAFAGSSLSALEQHVVLQTVNAFNACHYCLAAHSAAAIGMTRIDPAIDGALREMRALGDARLEALRRFTLAVVRERGRVGDDALHAFVDAGFTPAQVLEVVLGVGMKTVSNYVNHIAATPVDAAFAAHRVEALA
jgi:AhpD family alkylhydroperoxidase